MLVLAAFVIVLDVPTVRTITKVSAIDEREHIDLLLRASHGRLGHSGQEFTQETLRELCARGAERDVWPPCRPGRLDPADFAPLSDGTNLSIQEPPYYFVTGLSARALRAVTPGWESLVTWARALGAVWLLVGMYLVLRIGDVLGVARWPLVGALVLTAVLPTELHASTTVNPEVAAFAAGASVLLAALAWERGRAHLAWLVVTSALAVWVDSANAVGVLITLVYLALRSRGRARGTDRDARSGRRLVTALIAVAAGTLVLVGTWEIVEHRVRPDMESPAPLANRPATDESTDERTDEATDENKDDPTRPDPSPDGLPLRRILAGESIFGMAPPVGDIAPPIRRQTELSGIGYRTFSIATSQVLIGVLGIAVLGPWLDRRMRMLGVATVVSLVSAAAVIHLYNYYLNGYYDPIVPRYGISALPAIALLFAGVASQSRIARGALVVLAAGLYTTALMTLL